MGTRSASRACRESWSWTSQGEHPGINQNHTAPPPAGCSLLRRGCFYRACCTDWVAGQDIFGGQDPTTRSQNIIYENAETAGWDPSCDLIPYFFSLIDFDLFGVWSFLRLITRIFARSQLYGWSEFLGNQPRWRKYTFIQYSSRFCCRKTICWMRK